MLKIGEFAALTGISINMLRNYDKIGLLTPEHVDEVNRYRYYSERQIIVANQIQILKELGFSLKEISTIRSFYHKDIRELIQNKILEKEKERIIEQMRLMNHTINAIEENSEFALSTKITTFPLEM